MGRSVRFIISLDIYDGFRRGYSDARNKTNVNIECDMYQEQDIVNYDDRYRVYMGVYMMHMVMTHSE